MTADRVACNLPSVKPDTSPARPSRDGSMWPTVNLYNGIGISLNAVRRVGNPIGKGGALRGKINGWSRASRRRMRAFLLTHRPENRAVFSATFTIPGPRMVPGDAVGIFKAWSRRAEKGGVCAVWRMEVQKRGMLHWHLMMGCRDERGVQAQEMGQLWERCIVDAGVVRVWWEPKQEKNLARLMPDRDWNMEVWEQQPGEIQPGVFEDEPDVFDGPPCDRDVVCYANRMLLPGATWRAAKVAAADRTGAWLRYLQDHATKAKQEQIAEGCGRHWGVIGRKWFAEVEPDSIAELSDREFARVVRWLQRLATPRIKDCRAPFGRRAGYKIRRGRWGSSVWFTRTDTMSRMIEHAKTLSVEG